MELERTYFACDISETLDIAESIDDVENLDIEDRLIFTMAPVNNENLDAFIEWTWLYAESSDPIKLRVRADGHRQLPSTPNALYRAECHHKVIDLYLWLSLRFPD